jgi:hypothetical protein
VDFVEACCRLGQVRAAPTGAWRPRLAEPATRHDGPPSATWQAAGRALIVESERVLWSDAGRAARTYLARRGLSLAPDRLDPSWHCRGFGASVADGPALRF